jgi:uncharacterized coiled-coil protein SlyX
MSAPIPFRHPDLRTAAESSGRRLVSVCADELAGYYDRIAQLAATVGAQGRVIDALERTVATQQDCIISLNEMIAVLQHDADQRGQVTASQRRVIETLEGACRTAMATCSAPLSGVES